MLNLIENNESLFLILGIFSILGFLCSLALVPLIVLRIPANYFSHRHRIPATGKNRNNLLRWIFILLKNLLGLLILLLGIAMLLLPGQGLLTVLMGLLLMDFPGKYRLERWIITRGPVLKSVNWLRKRGERDPLQL